MSLLRFRAYPEDALAAYLPARAPNMRETTAASTRTPPIHRV
jgi:hypothetical protein